MSTSTYVLLESAWVRNLGTKILRRFPIFNLVKQDLFINPRFYSEAAFSISLPEILFRSRDICVLPPYLDSEIKTIDIEISTHISAFFLNVGILILTPRFLSPFRDF